jgi:hypothetical protein
MGEKVQVPARKCYILSDFDASLGRPGRAIEKKITGVYNINHG